MASDTETHPRDRLLETASRLFYAEGIHAVGVERLVKEASVTKATFYRHFPAKDDLVAAYLTTTRDGIRERVIAAQEGKDAAEALLAVIAVIGDATSAEDFRGCEFLNAAAEYPDPRNRVRGVIDEHRTWLHGVLADLTRRLGHPDPEYAARALILLVDGALQGGQFDADTRSVLLRAAADVVGLPATDTAQSSVASGDGR
ncbi:helix-turn-helix domain-containing protein [Microbacterium sp. KR10-403]|uniref:TetR/AcrR family transcriptional regulator n=1 Tax=Microbacterium sp. KR10-403 TaxID=3158581 RepID=UPI0032E51D92